MPFRRNNDLPDRLLAVLAERGDQRSWAGEGVVGTAWEREPGQGDASVDDVGHGGRAPRHRRAAPRGGISGRPRWIGVPDGVRGGESRITWPAVAGFLLVALVALTIFGLRLRAAQAAGVPVPVAPSGSASAGATVSRGPSATGPEPGGPNDAASSQVVVHVVGRVAKPGIVRLPVGSRVDDAIATAGGVTKGADLAAVNLARVVGDGEQIIVPKVGDPPVTTPGGGPGAGSAGGGGGSGTLVNLNTADAAALDSLPGVGPVLAQRILDWRQQNTRFSSVDELGEVSGIGEKLLAQLTPLVTV